MQQELEQITVAFADPFPVDFSRDRDFQVFVGGKITELAADARKKYPSAIIDWDGNYTATMAVLSCNREGGQYIQTYFEDANAGKVLNQSMQRSPS